MAVALVRTSWQGTSGGPGVTQMFVRNASTFGPLTATEAQAAVNAVRAFMFACGAYLPDELVLVTSAVVDMYDIPTGKLEASISAATAPASVVGRSTSTYSMAAGFKVNLNTTTIRNGRRVRGGIFLVPAGSEAFSSTGTTNLGVRTAINSAGATLLGQLQTAGLQLVVYSRPLDPEDKNGPRSGDVAPVTAVETNEKTAVLRGRRD